MRVTPTATNTDCSSVKVAFENACVAARRRVEWDARSSHQCQQQQRQQPPGVSPPDTDLQYSTTILRYQAVCRKRLVEHKSTIDLTFQRRHVRGWDITGHGTMVHKGRTHRFAISQGLLSDSHPKRRFYWIEQYHNNGREYVVKGKFKDFATSFIGYRFSDRGNETLYEGSILQELEKIVSPEPVPKILVTQAVKTIPDQGLGITFGRNEHGQVIVSKIRPETLLGEAPTLAVGMPVVLVNHQPIRTPTQAVSLLRDSPHLVTLITLRDGWVHAESPLLTHRLVSASIYKDTISTKTGFTFRHDGTCLYLGEIKRASPAETTGLESGMRVWAINQTTSFATSQAAANVIIQAKGWVTMVAERQAGTRGGGDTPAELGPPIITARAVPVFDKSDCIPVVEVKAITEDELEDFSSLGLWC